jgi:hypothetical protein
MKNLFETIFPARGHYVKNDLYWHIEISVVAGAIGTRQHSGAQGRQLCTRQQ